MIKMMHTTLFVLMAIGYSGCGGTPEGVTQGSEDPEMAALIETQEDVAQKVAGAPAQIDLDALNAVQEKLAEERK